jgi:hypothetical protein
MPECQGKAFQWLRFLERYNQAYQDMQVDADFLSRLPRNSDLLNDISVIDDNSCTDLADTGPNNDVSADNDLPLEVSSVTPTHCLIDLREISVLHKLSKPAF